MEGENTLSSGFIWPQRNYICSFCKRQFNSAQALGGHMNVHRRDRAMLIQLPSWVFDQSANPNSSSPSSPLFPSRCHSYTHQCPFKKSIDRPPFESSSEDLRTMKKKNDNNNNNNNNNVIMRSRVVEVEELNEELQLEVLKKSDQQLISLDLEIGCKDHSKEVLDLELRLGCF